LLTGIEGREEEVLLLPGRKGLVSIHPNVFHNVLDEVTRAGWQVIQEPFGLRVLLVGLAPSMSTEAVHTRLVSALTSASVVGTLVNVQLVETVERTPLARRRWSERLRNRHDGPDRVGSWPRLGYASSAYHGQPFGVPVPPVHSPPGSGALLPDLYVSMKVFNRGSLAVVSFSCTPHADATMGDGSPG